MRVLNRRNPWNPLLLALAALAAGCGGQAPGDVWPPTGSPTVSDQATGVDALLQAVSAADPNVVWVSGHEGAWARTTDGGESWIAGITPGAEALEFRDVQAFGGGTALLLSAGSGDASRIYRTVNGGRTWTLQWANDEPAGFYNCMDFGEGGWGVAAGDAVDGSPRILLTNDGGLTWRRVPDDALPPALPEEVGFAASGLCVEAGPDGRAWVGQGNSSASRILMTEDGGRSWRAVDVPITTGEGAGVTAIAMLDDGRGYAFGGVLHAPDEHTDNVARTEDGGRSWRSLPQLPFPGPVYGGLVVPGTGGEGLVAVGPGGAAVSADGGTRWITVDHREWWAVGSAGVGATWIAGPDGRVARIVW